MAERRVAYLAVLVGGVVFFWAYREWLSWILLLIIVFLPWLSFLVSLPAMLGVRVMAQCPASVPLGAQVQAQLVGVGKLPLPPIKGKFLVQRTLTGQKWRLRRNAQLPTGHCGQLQITPRRVWVYDYLGLLRLPVWKKQTVSLLVQPEPLAVQQLPDLEKYMANAWKPKPGGGFAENHELRLYRPGDNLRQLHWKLSAKMGKLILREPMEAVRGAAVLTMELSGSEEELDRKLGRLQWLSAHLLSRTVPHSLHCLTGNGMEHYTVQHLSDIPAMVDALLCSPMAQAQTAVGNTPAAWRCHIGGEANEA